MLATDVLGDTAKHSESEALLDEVVSKDGRGNTVENTLSHVRLASLVADGLLVLIGQLDDLLVTEALHVVCLDESGEDGEAVLDVRAHLVLVLEDASDFNFITRSSRVHEVVEHVDFLLARDTAWRHRARRLLDGPLLIVAVDRLELFQVEDRLLVHADGAGAEDLAIALVDVKVDGAFLVVANDAAIHRLSKLREDRGTLGDNATDLDELVQVRLAKVTKLVLHREVTDADEHAVVDALVVGVQLEENVHRCLVEDGQHECRLLSEPDCQCGQLVGKIVVDNLQALLVCLAHLVDLLLGMVLEEVSESAVNELDGTLVLQPLLESALHIIVVDGVLHVILVHVVAVVGTTLVPEHAVASSSHGLLVLFVIVEFHVGFEGAKNATTLVVSEAVLLGKLSVDLSAGTIRELLLTFVIEAVFFIAVQVGAHLIIIFHVLLQVFT